MRFQVPTLPRTLALNKILAAASDASTLTLDLFGFVGEGEFTSGAVAKALTDDVKLVKIRLNSDGGIATEGFAIYNLLRNHSARVEIEVLAAAMSAASYILMAADKSRIHSNAVVMIHEAWGGMQGRADDFESQASELRRINDHMIKAYAARAGDAASEDEIREMVSAETYLEAERAVELGLVDELIKERAPAKAVACLRADVQARINIHPPQAPAAQETAEAEGKSMDPEELKKAIKSALEDMSDEELAELGLARAEEDGEESEELDAEAKAAAETLAAIKSLIGNKAAANPVAAIKALKRDASDVVALRASVKALEQDRAERELERELEAACDRVPPAMAETFKTQVREGLMTIEGVKAIVASLPKIPGFVASGERRPQARAVSADHKFKGKTWTEMNGAEKAVLYREDHDLYTALRAAHA